MTRILTILLCLLLTIYPVVAQTTLPFSSGPITAPPATLFIPAANNVATNWQNAGLLPIGGIPTRSTVCATVNASGVTSPGAGDDQAHITTAIAGCTTGQVVQLGTGTFNFFLSELPFVINKSITLRGTGTAVGTCNAFTGTPCWGTYLRTYDGPQPTWNPTPQCGVTISPTTNCPNTSGFIMMAPAGPFNFGWGNGTGCAAAATSINPQTQPCGTTLTADAAQGDTVIHVTSAASLSVGMIMLIDEAPVLQTTTNPVSGQASIQASAEFLNTTPTPVVARIANPDAGNCTYSFCVNRVTQELKKITNISGTTITFDTPLTIGFRTAHDARAYWPTAQTSSTPNPFVSQVGLENLTIDRCTGGCVHIEFCNSCWVSNVEISGWIGGAINMEYGFRPYLLGNYLHNGYDLDNNGQEYPIGMSTGTTECLVENNIIIFGGKGMVGRANNSCVVSYNYVDKTMYMMFSGSIGDYWNDMNLNCSHYAGGHHCLFEGNWASNCDGDETHGNMTYMTWFRNQCTGLRTTFVDPSNSLTVNDCNGTGFSGSSGTVNTPNATGPQRAAGPMAFGYWMAYAGNVLGQSGMQSCSGGAFVYNGTTGSSSTNRAIWISGWTGSEWATLIDANLKLSNASAFIFRNGNFDYVNNSVVDNASGYSQAFPNSLYLPSNGASPPSWWPAGSTTYPYPWIDASSGTPVKSNSLGGSGNPAKARADAGTPFNQP